MISQNEGWTYLQRGSGREGLVRYWEKHCWGILTNKGRDYDRLIYALNAYFDKAKAELIPEGTETELIDINNLEDPDRGLAKINEKLSQHAIRESMRTKQKFESCKITVTPTKDTDGKHARVIPVPHRTFKTDELEALKKFCNDRKPSDIAYRVNTEFFPPGINIMFMAKSQFAVRLNIKQPENMVVQIQEILEKTNAPYEAKLELEDVEAPMVSMLDSQESIEVA